LPIINTPVLAALSTNISTIFNNAYAQTESIQSKIATEVPSTKGSNTYGWLGQTTGFREWLGDRVIQNLGKHDYTIKNKKFENTVSVKRDDIEDDDMGGYNMITNQLGYDAKIHPDELVFNALKNGTSQKCYDGQNFFDTDHPVEVEGGTQSVSNYVDGANPAWYLLDTSRPIKPIIFQKRRNYNLVSKFDPKDESVFNRDEFVFGVDARVNAGYGLWQMAFCSKADLTADNFNAAYAAMSSYKSDAGKPLNIKPKILLVPQALRTKAAAIIADKINGGDNNPNANIVEVVATSWIA